MEKVVFQFTSWIVNYKSINNTISSWYILEFDRLKNLAVDNSK